MSDSDFGSADYVSTLTTAKEVEWGGFRAALVAPEGAILVQATRWRGSAQPRLVLDDPASPAYHDWKTRLDEAPEHTVVHRFVGAAAAARNAFDQWLTHGPSPLLR